MHRTDARCVSADLLETLQCGISTGLVGDEAGKMKQRRDPLLGHFCRSLNENVTRAALIKFCAERS
jgi:hypothetical protein